MHAIVYTGCLGEIDSCERLLHGAASGKSARNERTITAWTVPKSYGVSWNCIRIKRVSKTISHCRIAITVIPTSARVEFCGLGVTICRQSPVDRLPPVPLGVNTVPET